VLAKLGAIVTDRGGRLSHAAIVAREAGVPAVVGTEIATKAIRDGVLVVVDGTRGVVSILER
jgi:phosphoenolpyruvate synthase/pyruvate phosphate dikinase